MKNFIGKIKTARLLKWTMASVLLILGLAWLGFFDLFIFSPFGQVPIIDNPPWGISKDELLKSKNQPYKRFNYFGNDGYKYKEMILNHSASVNYIFHGEKLDHILIGIPTGKWLQQQVEDFRRDKSIGFPNGQWSRKQWDDFIRDIKKHLIATVGRGHICEDSSKLYQDKWASFSLKFRRGRTYGHFYSASPDDMTVGTWFNLYDGLSPDAKGDAMFTVCHFYGEYQCWSAKRKNICPQGYEGWPTF
jgi:hypothetical protein